MSSSFFFFILLLKKIYYFLLNNLFLWCFSLWRKRKILSLAISLYHAGSSKVAYRFPKYIQVVLWNFEIRKNLYRNLSEIACLWSAYDAKGGSLVLQETFCCRFVSSYTQLLWCLNKYSLWLCTRHGCNNTGAKV